MMVGQWRKEKETKETIIDGWIHRGDIGKIDEDDFIQILVRKKKNMIITDGLNVYSADVQSVPARHPDVAEVIVLDA